MSSLAKIPLSDSDSDELSTQYSVPSTHPHHVALLIILRAKDDTRGEYRVEKFCFKKSWLRYSVPALHWTGSPSVDTFKSLCLTQMLFAHRQTLYIALNRCRDHVKKNQLVVTTWKVLRYDIDYTRRDQIGDVSIAMLLLTVTFAPIYI